MTVLEAIQASLGRNSIPTASIELICLKRGISASSTLDYEVSQSNTYRLCEADVIKCIIASASISEGGVSISDSDKDKLVNLANDIYRSCGEPEIGQDSIAKVVYRQDWE